MERRKRRGKCVENSMDGAQREQKGNYMKNKIDGRREGQQHEEDQQDYKG